jgi:poly-gamma-glutamate capsule biosynthesis protein CapA/YwtB (metallophosphatase superfamily)
LSLRFNVFFLTLFILCTSCKSQEAAIGKIITPDTTKLKLVFIGDVMGHMPVVYSAWVDSLNRYDFNPIYEYVASYITKADVAIANLEVPLAGKPYSGYPQFSSPNELGESLKNNGIDVAILANNHALDRGKKGLLHTLKILDSLEIQHTGIFRDTSERRKKYPLFLTVNKIKLAFLNYTFSTNGIKAEKPVIVNYLDTSVIKKDIEQCHKHKADFIIVNLHWGIEYDRFSNKEQHIIANCIARNGAHAIVGSHPHVVQPFALIYPFKQDSSLKVPVQFSIGNFISNQRDRYRDGGIIFELNIFKTGTKSEISTGFLPVWVYKGLYRGKMMYKLITPSKLGNAMQRYQISKADSVKCAEFFTDTRQHLSNLKEITDKD